MDLSVIFQNMVEHERITREERRRRLASKVLTCPKCKGTSILVEETMSWKTACGNTGTTTTSTGMASELIVFARSAVIRGMAVEDWTSLTII